MDGEFEARLSHAEAIESAILNYELAYRMQMEVPDVTDLSQESEATKKLYGIDAPQEHSSVCSPMLDGPTLSREGRTIRRLTIIRGTATAGISTKPNRWPSEKRHGRGSAHRRLDQGFEVTWIARYDPCVQWRIRKNSIRPGNQRTRSQSARIQPMDGGRRNQGGTIYGATDEYGYRVVENKLTVHDLHANMPHLLGIDHTKLITVSAVGIYA